VRSGHGGGERRPFPHSVTGTAPPERPRPWTGGSW
jgi:hypothetical protein